MTTRLLTYEDLSTLENAEAVATLFNKLGYKSSCQPLTVEDLQLSDNNAEVIKKVGVA